MHNSEVIAPRNKPKLVDTVSAFRPAMAWFRLAWRARNTLREGNLLSNHVSPSSFIYASSKRHVSLASGKIIQITRIKLKLSRHCGSIRHDLNSDLGNVVWHLKQLKSASIKLAEPAFISKTPIAKAGRLLFSLDNTFWFANYLIILLQYGFILCSGWTVHFL